MQTGSVPFATKPCAWLVQHLLNPAYLSLTREIVMSTTLPPINPALDTSRHKAIPQIQSNPHFAQIGGVDGITRLVERFYFHMNSQPQAMAIRAMHAADLTETKAVLVLFLTEWLGGPRVYSSQRGHPRLRQRHAMFGIGAAERDAWMLCMRLAMQDEITQPVLRQQLEQAFFKTADFIRNQQT